MSRGYINNQAVAVLNKIERDDSDTPIAMTEARTKADGGNLSANLGTVRDPMRGRCLQWDTINYIKVVASNGDISSVSALDEAGSIITLTATYVTDHYQIRGIDGEYTWNIKCWGTGITPTDIQKSSYTLAESVEADLFTWFKCDEGLSDTIYRAYSGGVDGIITDATTTGSGTIGSIHQFQDFKSFQDDDSFTLSDGATYYSDNGGVNLIPAGVYIPKDESISLPPFKCTAYLANGEQALTEHYGSVPSRADIVEGACFDAFGTEYYTIDNVVLAGDFKISYWFNNTSGSAYQGMILSGTVGVNGSYIFHKGGSDITLNNINNEAIYQCYFYEQRDGNTHLYEWGRTNDNNITLLIDGVDYPNEVDTIPVLGNFEFNSIGKGFIDGNDAFNLIGNVFDIIVEDLDNSIKHRWTLSEPIKDATNHTAYDIVGGNSATLINGSTANQGVKENAGDWLQNGIYVDGSGNTIPILEDFSAFADGTILSSGTTQDGYSFLDTGTSKLQMYNWPALIQSEITNNQRFWYIGEDQYGESLMRKVTPYDLAVENAISDRVFIDTNENN